MLMVVLSVRKLPRTNLRLARYKYLITWSLCLERDDLQKVSVRPEALQKGLNYVKEVAKGSKLAVYRVVEMEEITHRVRPSALPEPAEVKGIAIAEGGSVEEIRRLVDEWVEGLTYGGMPVGGRLEFEIKQLMELT
jgi:hypothetical protein